MAIAIDPANAVAYRLRGYVRLLLEDLDGAEADLSQAIRLEPANADAFVLRGAIRAQAGDPAGAIADYEGALRLDPEAIFARNNVAWLLATCPDDRFRDGSRAAGLATEACDRTGWRDANCLGTLSAAHAECGNFAEAMRVLERAIELGPDGENAAIRQTMLDAFRRGDPVEKCGETHPVPDRPTPR